MSFLLLPARRKQSLYPDGTLAPRIDIMASSDSNLFQPDIENIEEFLQRFKLQNYEVLHKARNDHTKQAMLLAKALPVTILTDIQRRLHPTLLQDASYDDIEKHLTAAYGIKKSLIGASVAFHTRKQEQHESIEGYSRSLNQLASKCGYSDCCRDRNLRDVFVSGLHSKKIISALISECEEKKFHECVERAKMMEQMLLDVEDINPTEPSDKYLAQNKLQRTQQTNKTVPKDYKCIRCGQTGSHFAHDCFAINKTCHKCQKKGHLSSVCRSKLTTSTANNLTEDYATGNAGNYAVPQRAYSDTPTRSERADVNVHSSNRFHALRDECAANSRTTACSNPASSVSIIQERSSARSSSSDYDNSAFLE